MHLMHCVEWNSRQRKCFYSMPRWWLILLFVAQFQRKIKNRTVWMWPLSRWTQLAVLLGTDSENENDERLNDITTKHGGDWRSQIAIIITIRWKCSSLVETGRRNKRNSFHRIHICQRSSSHLILSYTSRLVRSWKSLTKTRTRFNHFPSRFFRSHWAANDLTDAGLSSRCTPIWIRRAWPVTHTWNFQMTIIVINTLKRTGEKTDCTFYGSDHVASVYIIEYT